MQNPIIFRKKHQKIVSDYNSEINGLQNKIRELETKLETANDAVKVILPRLLRLQEPVRNREFNTYRICVDFHRDMIERAFIHGGDESQIRYLAELIGHEIERKITQFNFARCDRQRRINAQNNNHPKINRPTA